MKIPKQTMDAALVEVRKAYRLLHDYQQSVLDVARYIGAQLGLRYSGGYSNFSDSAPRPGKGSLDNWAWDWLNLMFYDFHFRREEAGGDVLNLSMWLFSDTGYYVSDDPGVEKTLISTFAPVESSGTKVAFLLYQDWKDNYGDFMNEREPMRRFVEKNGELPDLLKKGGVAAMCFDFARLSDEESADTVIDELVQLAKANGFALERVKKAA